MKIITLFVCRLPLTIVLLMGVCSSPVLAFSVFPDDSHIEIEKGVLDLRDWDFEQNGVVDLTGEWRFFWNRLLKPSEIEKIEHLEHQTWIKVPGAWNDDDFEGGELPGNGSATYSLLIRLPEIDGPLALRLRDVFTAYRLFANDRVVAEVGRVSEDKSRFTPALQPRTVFVTAEQSTLRLTFQVSNYVMPYGGPFHAPQLGMAEALAKVNNDSVSIKTFLLGILVIMTFYHFGLFLLRREDKSPLWFGLVCLVMSIRALFTGQRIAFNYIADWSVAFKMDILTVFWGVPLFYIFFQTVYPRYLSKKLVWSAWAFALISSVIILLTGANTYVHLLMPSHFLFLACGAYIIVCLVLEIKSGSKSVKWAIIGFVVLFITMVNDILVSNRIIFTPYLIQFGVVAFILAQSLLLSIRFSRAFSEAKTTGEHLRQEVIQRSMIEKKLRESERKFRELADFLPIPVAELDFEFKSLYINLSAQQMFDLSSEDVSKGASIRPLIPDQFIDQVRDSLNSLRMGVIPDPLELFLVRKNGKRIWGQAYASLISMDDEYVGIRVCFVDLSARKEAELNLQKSHDELETEVERRTQEIREAMEAAKESNKLKSEFLANISHELRNPMHQILSYSQFGIQKIEKPREKLLHYFHQTRSAAEKLMILLNDLLDLSKLESGRAEYQMESLDICEIISEIVEEYRQAFSSVGLAVVLKGINCPIMVWCDGFKIGQVLRNLLTNSFKYSGDSKSIEISVELTDLSSDDTPRPGVRVSVKDSGVGIPENELETIFDKFTQSSLTKTGAGGTGLGLAISQEIIHAHKGTIWAVNNDDQGATFSLTLPLVED